jgi:hypothetical protein
MREVLDDLDPDPNDAWYIRFRLKLDAGVVDQIPDDILVAVDDRTGEVVLHYQM